MFKNAWCKSSRWVENAQVYLLVLGTLRKLRTRGETSNGPGMEEKFGTRMQGGESIRAPAAK